MGFGLRGTRFSALVLLLGVTVALFGCVEIVDDPKTSVLVELINEGKTSEAAAMMQYPPDWTTEERLEDVESISRGIAFARSEFGQISNLERRTGIHLTYWLRLMGGTTEYWSSFAGDVSTADFSATFSNLGEGYLSIHYVGIGEERRVKSIGWGLAASRPGALEQMKDLLLRLEIQESAVTGEPLPKDLESMIEASLP